MKAPVVFALAGLAGLTISVRALRGNGDAVEPSVQTTYYANGQVDTECETREGRRDGHCAHYSAAGKKLSEGTYAAGRMEGAWTFWLEDGSVDSERSGNYAAGERVAP
jgi:antitoxin component YwqK of YwqJK toxin-antitoxin module